MKTILFLCTGNSCRSQMAEGYARKVAPAGTNVCSAGIEPQGVNPGAVKAMQEIGIDISGRHSKDISEVPVDEIDTVITLCGNAAENCPVFPGKVERMHWDIDDPAKASGTEEEIAEAFRSARDKITGHIDELFGAKRTGD